MEDVIPWTKFQKKLVQLVEKTPPSGRFPALNAIRHVEMAWQIRNIDREMTAFRFITGIEEAVTAVFHALRHRKYENAKLFLKTKHFHKWSMVPMIGVVLEMFKALNMEHPELAMNVKYREKAWLIGTDKKLIRDRLWIVAHHPETGLPMYPIPPLEATVTNADGTLTNFSQQLNEKIKRLNVNSMQTMIHSFANHRNLLLYASAIKLPTLHKDVDTSNSTLRSAQQVMDYITLYLLVEQWPQRQSLVQQAINALIEVVPQLQPRQRPEN